MNISRGFDPVARFSWKSPLFNSMGVDFENFSKIGFPSFEWEKVNFTTLVPPLEKFWENPPVPPPGKNPSDAHVRRYT